MSSKLKLGFKSITHNARFLWKHSRCFLFQGSLILKFSFILHLFSALGVQPLFLPPVFKVTFLILVEHNSNNWKREEWIYSPSGCSLPGTGRRAGREVTFPAIKGHLERKGDESWCAKQFWLFWGLWWNRWVVQIPGLLIWCFTTQWHLWWPAGPGTMGL